MPELTEKRKANLSRTFFSFSQLAAAGMVLGDIIGGRPVKPEIFASGAMLAALFFWLGFWVEK